MMIHFDLIIKNACIITMKCDSEIVTNGYLAIIDKRISRIGSGDLPVDFSASKIIDAGGNLVLPGFVNTHTHAAMTIFRGYADDLPLMEWLNNYIWPAEDKYINAETVKLGTQLACVEMLKSGITSFNDMYFFEGEVAEAAKSVGIRAMIGEAFLDSPVPIVKVSAEYHLELIEKYRNDSLIHSVVVAHAPYSCSKEVLLYSKALSDKYNLPFSIHLSESEFEFHKFKNETGLTPVEYLDQLGVLDHKTVAVHCIKLTARDIEILANRQVGISHNPKSNLKLANGFSPIPTILSAGVKVGLGTDGAASNNTLNMYEEIGFTSRMHKGFSQDPTVVKAAQVLAMATIEGAKVIGLDKVIGSLEIGKLADLQIVNIHKPHLTPMYNPLSHLAYAVQAADVDTVIVNGKIVMENRKILNIDENELMYKVNVLAQKIRG